MSGVEKIQLKYRCSENLIYHQIVEQLFVLTSSIKPQKEFNQKVKFKTSKKTIIVNMQDILNKFQQRLTGRSIGDLVRQQRAICREINVLMRAIRMCPSLADSAQIDITKLILQKIHKPVVAAVRLQEVREQQVGLYQYLMARLPFGFAAGASYYKQNTRNVHMNQIVNRSTNQVMSEFASEDKLVPPASVREPMLRAFEMWHFQEQADEKVFVVTPDVILSEKTQEKLSQYLCGAFNHFNAAIVVGLNKYSQIQGVKLTTQQIQEIRRKIEGIRKQHIHPPPCPEEIFQISVTKVQQNFALHNLVKPIPDMSQIKNYLIKIYVNTERVGKAYFVKELSKKNPGKKYEYTFVKNPTKQSLSLKSYQQMHLAYRQNKDAVQPKIVPERTASAQDELQIKAGVYVKKEQPEQVNRNMYGRVPEKTLAHHSILVLSPKGDQYFKVFLKNFQGDDNLRYSQIYENLPKQGKRKVLYLTHRKNPDDLKRFVQEEIDTQRKNLVLMKIKPQLTLLKQEFFQKAYKTLKQRYQNFFREPLKVVYRRSLIKPAELEFYFCFSDEERAIFAFTLLQLADYRTNFANPGKLAGCQPIQKLLPDFPTF